MNFSLFPRSRVSGCLFLIPVLLLLVTAGIIPAAAEKVPVPETKRKVVVDTLHGMEIEDPYRWLEDQEAPATRDWISRQNQYTHSYLDRVEGREKIKERLVELMKIDRIGIPREREGRYFLTKRSAEQQQFVIYMREGLRGEDRVLVDPHPMSADHTTSVNIMDISRDGTLLAYGIREGGADEVAVRFLDVDKMEKLPARLEKGLYFGISIIDDRSGFYYSRHNPMVGSRVFYHEMGTDPKEDREIFGEGFGPESGIGAGITEDGRYLAIMVFHGSAGRKSEVYYKNLEEDGPIVPLVNDIDARFTPHYAEGTVFLETNWKAPRGRVLKVDMENPDRENWEEIIPESDNVIRGVSLAGGYLFVNYLEDVVSKIKVYQPDGDFEREISFPTLGTVSGMVGRWDSNEAFFVFTSFHVPTRIYRYDVRRDSKDIWVKLDVPVDVDNIEVEQIWYESGDGTEVPMFIVHRKGMELNGRNPTLLTGYGGFNVSLTPGFRSTGVLWTEYGGIYAVANLRGGGEYGEEWHRAGMMENKQNVFDDFIAAAEYLVDKGYTSPSKLSIRGGSNGGLLVGAAMVQRPDLYQAVVCTYPLLDMLRFHKFLLGKFWVSEYGSAEEEDQFEFLYEYSPYHNVEKGEEYPSALFITGDSDTRVAPLHARKMTAMLQYANSSDNPIMLLYDTKAGHSGGKPVDKQIEDTADELMYLLWQLGMNE